MREQDTTTRRVKKIDRPSRRVLDAEALETVTGGDGGEAQAHAHQAVANGEPTDPE